MDRKGRKRRANSQERWELQQLRAAGAIDQSDMPEYDEETGDLEQQDSGGKVVTNWSQSYNNIIYNIYNITIIKALH